MHPPTGTLFNWSFRYLRSTSDLYVQDLLILFHWTKWTTNTFGRPNLGMILNSMESGNVAVLLFKGRHFLYIILAFFHLTKFLRSRFSRTYLCPIQMSPGVLNFGVDPLYKSFRQKKKKKKSSLDLFFHFPLVTSLNWTLVSIGRSFLSP